MTDTVIDSEFVFLTRYLEIAKREYKKQGKHIKRLEDRLTELKKKWKPKK